MTNKQRREHKMGNQARKVKALEDWKSSCEERRNNPRKFQFSARLDSPVLVQNGKYTL